MIDNQEALAISITNPEPLIDPDYGRNVIIISNDPNHPNDIMHNNNSLRDLIAAHKIAIDDNNNKYAENLIPKIKALLDLKAMNCTEFASYWQTHDVSHSMYKDFSLDDKNDFLRFILPRYAEFRHALYGSHGYSATTIQTIHDRQTHKGMGQLTKDKIANILHRFCCSKCLNYIQDVELPHNQYIFPDDSRNGFDAFIADNKIKLKWSSDRTNKIPDLLLKYNNRVFISEFKHMKEDGGEQNKQAEELINFIKQEEPETDYAVHYISFLDGILFNKIFIKDHTPRQKKKIKLKTNAKNALLAHPNNYFVNTAGFKALIESLVNAE